MKTKRIGSYHWMQATNGQLSFKEKVKLIQKLCCQVLWPL